MARTRNPHEAALKAWITRGHGRTVSTSGSTPIEGHARAVKAAGKANAATVDHKIWSASQRDVQRNLPSDEPGFTGSHKDTAGKFYDRDRTYKSASEDAAYQAEVDKQAVKNALHDHRQRLRWQKQGRSTITGGKIWSAGQRDAQRVAAANKGVETRRKNARAAFRRLY